MKLALAAMGLIVLPLAVAFGQTTDTKPAFELADIHVSPRSTTTVMRLSARPGRYEIHNATMVDLIRTAYNVNPDDVLGGPSWLEYDRFEVIALVPAKTTPDDQKLMLQSLLADRFKLAVRQDTKPVAGLVLLPGKGKHKLKEAADPAAAPGCQTQPVPAPAPSGVPGQLVLPMTAIACHSVTMETFALELKRLANAYVTNAVQDQTGLKGSWDFDLKYTQKALLALGNAQGASVTSLADAIDRQLGLKLDEQKIPTPVIVVEQANEKPTPNPPEVAAKLTPPPPMEFEVADIKPVDPNARRNGSIQIGVLPGGRVNLPGIPLNLVIALAWNLPLNTLGASMSEQVIGAPKWLDTANFDIIGKLPAELAPANGSAIPLQELGPALQALLIERFKMKFHFEDRPVNAYKLISVKPKLKKADPSTRTGCKPAPNNGTALISTNGPTQTQICQNITMAQFAEQLQIFAGIYLNHPVMDATSLEGAWDFSLSFNPIPAALLNGLRVAAPAGATPTSAAADPIGGGASLFDAVEKQLGLKLEVEKRTYPVFVIDHIEEKPTDN